MAFVGNGNAKFRISELKKLLGKSNAEKEILKKLLLYLKKI